MAKNTKTGLGRGLNSLLGGYEAAMESPHSTTPASEQAKETKVPASKKEVIEGSRAPVDKTSQKKSESSREVRTVEREVIREEDLPQEDRIVIDGEKKEQASSLGGAAEAVKPKTAVKDVVAKEEYIEENDGVTIVGIAERAVEQLAATPSGSKPMEGKVAVVSEEEEGTRPASDEIPIGLVKPNPDQPRMHFNKEELGELAASIKKDGLLQPILVREVADGYEIIAGERRWQACKLAGMDKVPVRIKEADDLKILELALIENLQRSDLNPIEEAYGYKRMMERGGRTQSEVAAAVSKGRSTVANALRLLDLPEEAQQLLYEEKITAGHARAILSIPTPEGRKKLTDKLKKEKLSVREAEAIARLLAGRNSSSSSSPRVVLPPVYKTTAKNLSTQLEAKVRIRSANGKNKLEIEFKDEEDLRRVLRRMREQDLAED